MFGRKKKTADTSDTGTVDGGEGRGVPLGGRDERPPTGYRSNADLDFDIEKDAGGGEEDPDHFWEDGDPADRRRDPLRKP